MFYCRTRVCSYGHAGHLMEIVKALYGLKSSGSWFHEKFADSMTDLGFSPSKADSNVWMNDKDTHYEYVCAYVDDLIYAGKQHQSSTTSSRTLATS